MVTLPGAKWTPEFKPLWRKPSTSKRIKSWPPASPFAKSEVDYLDFWNLARKYDRENPWDIIIYNFGTEDPWEVNWYLHHAVGCWRSSDDKNFSFDNAKTADGNPGVMYIPQPSWRPDPKFVKGSGAGRFLDALVSITASILIRVARRIPTLQHGNTIVTSSGIEKIAELVTTREIAVVVDPSLDSIARYEDLFKTITLRKVPTLRSIGMHGTLANEATHAVTHWGSRSVNLFKNETASSFVQSVTEASFGERRILRRMENTFMKYDKLYFPGWVWLNYFNSTSILSLSDMNRMFPHPIHGEDRNPRTELIAYMDSMKSYRDKRGKSWAYDWNF